MIKRVPLLLLFVCLSAAVAQTSSFPASVATDADMKVQVNGKQTTLSVGINSAVTSATVASCTGIVNNTLATINTEIIAIASCSGNTLTMSTTSPGCTNGRACDGTSAASHVTGASVSLFADAWHHNMLRVQVEAMQTALYAGASPTFANITSAANITGLAVNFNDNTGSGISGHFGVDALVGGINKSLYFRNTAGAVMLEMNASGGVITSNLNMAVGTALASRTLTMNGSVFIQAEGVLTAALTTTGSAISGTTTFNSGTARGVYGSSTHGAGVYGVAVDGSGVIGISSSSTGISGISTSDTGVAAGSTSGTALTASSVSGAAANFNGQVQLTGSNSGGYGLDISTGTGGAITATAATGVVLNGVATASATSAILADTGGTCQIHGASGIACVSDRSVKTGIHDVPPSLSKVMRLRPVEYQMKSDGQHSAGLIAQDVREQFPLAVGSTEDGKLTLSYQEIVPYLIKAIQEQQSQIAALRHK